MTRRSGFTILEIIATLFVLSITMAGLLLANDRNLESSQRAVTREDCLMLARDYLEEILRKGSSEVAPPDFSQRGEYYASYKAQPAKTDQMTVVGGESIYKIEVTVTHPEDQISVTLATYVR